jgi:hypothetical protein
MPFLRRRGNMPSETDIRKHTFGLSSSNPIQVPPTPQPVHDAEPAPSSDAESTDGGSDAGASENAEDAQAEEEATHTPSLARPDSPPVQEETQKHRRFSALRFRNASDSQLSLKARKQAEKPPPLPGPREFPTP